MIATPERSPERDAAIEAMLPRVADTGWTMATLLAAAGPDADLLFPGGPLDIIEAYVDWADRRMEAGPPRRTSRRCALPARVRAIVALRLEQNRPYKDAVRRALGVLSMPGNAALAARTPARTVDAHLARRRRRLRRLQLVHASGPSSPASTAPRCSSGCATTARTTSAPWNSWTAASPGSAASAGFAAAPRPPRNDSAPFGPESETATD